MRDRPEVAILDGPLRRCILYDQHAVCFRAVSATTWHLSSSSRHELVCPAEASVAVVPQQRWHSMTVQLQNWRTTAVWLTSRVLVNRRSCLVVTTSRACLHLWYNHTLTYTITSMSVLLIVGLKCTLAASHPAPGESRWVCRQDRH